MFDFGIFKPFARTVWVAIIVLILSFSCILRLILAWHRHELRSASAFVLTFGAVCQQGFHSRAFSNSIRCLVIFLFVSGLLLYNFYTSVLVSTIVETRSKTPIKSREDLAESNVPVGFQNSGLVRNYMNVFIPLFRLLSLPIKATNLFRPFPTLATPTSFRKR